MPTPHRYPKLATMICLAALCTPLLCRAQGQAGKPSAYQDPAYQQPAPPQYPAQQVPQYPQQQQQVPAYQGQPPAYPQQAPQQYPAPQQQQDEDSLTWIPQGMSALSRQASSHTDFTFDRSMLALAGNLYGLDGPTRQSLARINGISVHSYRFPAPHAYDPGALQAVRAQYNALGWRHVVSSNTKPGPRGYGQGYGNGQTDLWVETRGMNVAGAAILLASPSSVNLIAVSGDLSTVDLLRLRGHFGIPKFDDNALPPMH